MIKVYCKNKKAEELLDKSFAIVDGTITALIEGGATSCCFTFHGTSIIGVFNSDICTCETREVPQNHLKVDVTDLPSAMRRVAMVLLYNSGFKGKDLRDFDISAEKVNPFKASQEAVAELTKKCECGGEKVGVGHSFWCPKYV